MQISPLLRVALNKRKEKDDETVKRSQANSSFHVKHLVRVLRVKQNDLKPLLLSTRARAHTHTHTHTP